MKYIIIIGLCFAIFCSCTNSNSKMEKQKEVKTNIEIDNYTIGNMLDSFLTLTPNILEVKSRCESNEDTVEFSNLYNLPCGILKHSTQN